MSTKRDRSGRWMLDRPMFAETERELLSSSLYAVSVFRYPSGVEAVRIKAGRGEFVWLPYLGQQIWEWNVDGASQKFEGFVKEPSYGKNFLQNYGGFLVHCGMTAMGNPGANDTHPHHGELPVAGFDAAWIELLWEDGGEELSLGGSLHWHVPFVAEYNCVPSVRVSSDGLSLHAEILLENPTAKVMDYMYLAHINFPFAGAKKILSTAVFDPDHVAVRGEPIPGLSANPELIKRIDQTADYDPELVAVVNDKDRAGKSAGSVVVYSDGTSNWVRQDTSVLDHHVVWITHTTDRGACGFHLPSTAGPTGFENEKVQGNIKHLPARSRVRLSYACGFCDRLDEVPVGEVR